AATGSASRHRAPRKDAFAKSPAPERRQPRRGCATAGYPTAVALFETEGIRHRLTRRESRQCPVRFEERACRSMRRVVRDADTNRPADGHCWNLRTLAMLISSGLRLGNGRHAT